MDDLLYQYNRWWEEPFTLPGVYRCGRYIGYLRDHVRRGRVVLVSGLLTGRSTTLVDNIIQKDIFAFHGLREHQLLRDYFTLLMEISGKQVSINKMANILKLSPDTARRYLNFYTNGDA